LHGVQPRASRGPRARYRRRSLSLLQDLQGLHAGLRDSEDLDALPLQQRFQLLMLVVAGKQAGEVRQGRTGIERHNLRIGTIGDRR
jgi:hypothetical protein